jgi:ribonucleotide reductase beta subunit family protein with ferritin-like domain
MADAQIKIFWPWDEIAVGKDKQDLLTNMSESEYHGVVSTLKLFTKYELIIGNEYWADHVRKKYPQVGIQRMAAAFSHVEQNSHAPFYNEINEQLGLGTMEFYTSYLNDPALSDRIKFLDVMLENPDEELATAVFSMAEGAILYSNLGYLKHFQSQGKNKIQNIVRGLNMTARDENLHALGGAAIVRRTLAEQGRTEYEMIQFRDAVHESAKTIYAHEREIISKIFEKGKQEGITEHQLDQFVKSRINLCLDNLNIPRIFTREEVKYNPIAEYFYKGVNDYQMNDFFQGIGREYQRDWKIQDFEWPKS